jgi:hypothetical protein
LVEAYIPGSTPELAWFDVGTYPFTRACTNVVISGNDFYRCGAPGVSADKTTGAQTGVGTVTVLAAESLIILGNTFWEGDVQGIDVKANT